MLILFATLVLLLGGAFASLFLRRGKWALYVPACALALAALAGIGFCAYALLQPSGLQASLPLPLPLGACLFSVDHISALFLIPVFLLSGLGGVLMPFRVRALEWASSGVPGVTVKGGDIQHGRHGFFYCILSAAMVLVLSASDAVFFLIAWEIMSLTPFFLISPQDKDSKERYAVWIYLVAAHLGALVLLLLFADMSVQADSTSFAVMESFARQSGWQGAGLLFVLALVGFGVKAGLAPLHMWMPEAHASAPGHVAVLLSGTMLNLGIYGIVRLLTLLAPDAFTALAPDRFWWSYLLMGIGAFSAVFGILLALAQSDMKRTLAYSSAENMGLICLALGAALLAGARGADKACVLLLAGAVLHMWNHSLFKSLLFLGANAVKESTHVTTIRHLGGLQKRIPLTGGCMALGCAAIAAVPPLNGFMSELLMYLGLAFGSEATRGTENPLIFWGLFFVVGSVAGLALFAFTRMFGLIFLGTPRSPESLEAKEPDRVLQSGMLLLAVLCLGVSLAAPWLFSLVEHSLRATLLSAAGTGTTDLSFAHELMYWYALAALVLLALFSLAWLVRRSASWKSGPGESPTWDCGYRYPSARMQYSGGSFSLSLALVLRPLLRPMLRIPAIRDLFPQRQHAVMSSPDWPSALWERLLFNPVSALAEWTKNLQSGLVNVYVLYIFIALVAALTWALGWS
ncbi:hypothetical protein LJC59_04350 [Desulfovibrio sp. OttesenSCG-928-A18]|nr:hypothetical protein [Desulfovibrio sp. OttesenSCG-928-A18]